MSISPSIEWRAPIHSEIRDTALLGAPCPQSKMASSWCHTSSYSSFHCSLPTTNRKRGSRLAFPRRRRPATTVASAWPGLEEFAGSVLQNKVLVAASVASGIGQLAKPFSKALKGEGIDLGAAMRSGGMPSTHSAAVVAVSTSLGLERGLSDSVFGMSVVIASIIMYDSQGVRREVGDHAKTLNSLKDIQVKPPSFMNEDDFIDPRLENSISDSLIPFLPTSENPKSSTDTKEPLLSPISQQALTRISAGTHKNMASNKYPDLIEDASVDTGKLNESVGHTEIQKQRRTITWN